MGSDGCIPLSNTVNSWKQMFSHTFSADPFPSGIETPDLIRNTFTYGDENVECEVSKNLDL